VDLTAALAGLALCLYPRLRYPELSARLNHAAPLDGILMSGALALLVLEGTRRMAGFSLVGFNARWSRVRDARPLSARRVPVAAGDFTRPAGVP